MSRDEERAHVVDAYLSGTVDRRIFIRRLVATGVSVAAAVTYAGALSGEVAAAASPNAKPPPDLYGVSIALNRSGPKCVKKKGAVRANITVTPRVDTNIVSVSDPVMTVDKITGKNAWVIHLISTTGKSIPAHNATVVVSRTIRVGTSTQTIQNTYTIPIPAFSCPA